MADDGLDIHKVPESFLHASISCKWTIRSDRAQHVRLEAINLASKRRGRMPHFVFVTSDPLPSRLTAVARGDGALDCTYHVALEALWKAVRENASNDQIDELRTLIRADKLRPLRELADDLLTVPQPAPE